MTKTISMLTGAISHSLSLANYKNVPIVGAFCAVLVRWPGCVIWSSLSFISSSLLLGSLAAFVQLWRSLFSSSTNWWSSIAPESGHRTEMSPPTATMMPLRTSVLKPATEAVTSYDPAGTLEIR